MKTEIKDIDIMVANELLPNKVDNSQQLAEESMYETNTVMIDYFDPDSVKEQTVKMVQLVNNSKKRGLKSKISNSSDNNESKNI